jgi:hypothetical protein
MRSEKLRMRGMQCRFARERCALRNHEVEMLGETLRHREPSCYATGDGKGRRQQVAEVRNGARPGGGLWLGTLSFVRMASCHGEEDVRALLGCSEAHQRSLPLWLDR